MLSLVRLHHIIAHSVTSNRGEGSKRFLFKSFLWEWKAMWERNPGNEEELQQGSHARRRDLEMMKQRPTLEQRALQILQVPSLSKPIQEAKPPQHTLSHFMPSHKRLISAERWSLKPDKSFTPFTGKTNTFTSPEYLFSVAGSRFIQNLCLCLFVKMGVRWLLKIAPLTHFFNRTHRHC